MMEDPKIQVIGPSSKNQGPHQFYKGFKYTFDGLERVISLGKFFFMKILDDMPICVGELQLVWEDRNCPSELASVKLYFVPEDTPEGRLPTHGGDEILAYSEKMTLKLDDLVNLIVHNVTWIEGRKGVPDKALLTHPEHKELADAFKMNSYGLSCKDIQTEIESTAQPTTEETEIVVMTYPRYCRYRGVLRRLENCTDKWLKHALVCAIGGFSAKSANNRIYFCRNIFDHPDLDEFELRCEHYAPSFKTRDRRRKSWKRENSSEASEESSSSARATPTVTTPTKPGPKPLPKPIAKPAMKPGPRPRLKPGPKPFLSPFHAKIDVQGTKLGKRSTPLRNGIRLDKMKVSKDEQAFLIDLHKFMKSRNTPIGRIPSLGFKQIDLYQFYTMAEKIGGYEAVTTKRMWKYLFDQLGGNAGNTSAATCTRRHYEKLLLPYERWKKGDEIKAVGKKRKKRKILKPNTENENRPSISENSKPEGAVKENLVKKEPTEESKLASDDGAAVKVKVEKVPVKSEEIGRKEEIQNRALIIKQELENMKMRKDAKRLLLQKEKIWEDRRKYKFSEKGRKPSAGQKTVRQLLDQTGRGDDQNDNSIDSVHVNKSSKTEEIQDKLKVPKVEDVNEAKISENNQLLISGDSTHLPSSQGMPQNLISPINLPRPMFFPPFPPMSGLVPGVPGMRPMQFPFMIPQLGVPGIPTAMQPIHPLMSPLSADNKPLNELSRLVTKQKDIIDIPSAIDKQPGGQIKHSTVVSSSAPPPSNHTQIPKGPLTAGPTHRKGPVGPAHSNELKRQNPFPDSSKKNFPGMQLKTSKDSLSSSHKENEFKRQKMSVSPEQVFKASSGLGEIPVLDLSMKTLRAQEEKQRRGESLLFSTCFNKNRSNQSKGTLDTPQDLSLKSSKSSSQSSIMKPISSVSTSVSSSKHVPLNVPLHPLHSETRTSTSGTTTVPSKTNTAQYEGKEEKSVPGNVPPFSLGVLPSNIGGLPIDFTSAFIHPAFRNPMMIQPGAFPTPVQLQQMIQGQVAANFPMLRPGLMQNPIQLFQPAFPVSSAGISGNNSINTDAKR